MHNARTRDEAWGGVSRVPLSLSVLWALGLAQPEPQTGADMHRHERRNLGVDSRRLQTSDYCTV